MKINTTVLLGTGLLTLSPFFFNHSSDKEAQQEGMEMAAGPVAESFNEVVLSSEDEAILHNSFLASAVLFGENPLKPNGKCLQRVISLASYVTVKEEWETTLSHCLLAVDAMRSSEVVFSIGYDFWPKPGGSEFNIVAAPKLGLTWGKVKDINDLQFLTKLTSKH